MIRSAVPLAWLLLCPFISLFAQIGPGGVGTATSNGLWLRADAINLANGSLLNSWNDQSAYGNSARMDTVAFRPTYHTSSQLNGQPVVRLDGINDRLLVNDNKVLSGTPSITFLVVLRPNDLDGKTPQGILGKRINFNVDENYAYTWFFFSSNDLSLDINSDSNRFSSGTARFTNATNYILSWDFDGTRQVETRARQYAGGAMVSSKAFTASTVDNSDRPLILGALNDNYRAYLGADYAEVIHYNYALNATERLIVNNYLSGKYAIPLASGDLYVQDEPSRGNYDHDIAGIGRLSSTDRHTASRGSGLLTIENPRGLDDNEFLFWGHDGTEVTDSESSDLPPTVIERMSRRWRVSEVTTAGSSADVGTIDLTFDLKNVGAYTADNIRLLVDTDNDGSFADETPIGGAQLIDDEVFTFVNVSAIADGNRFTIGMADANLPVTLTQFTASTFGNGTIVLQWSTATESDNDYFQIERSTVGWTWSEIGRVKGGGTVTGERQYKFVDHEPLEGSTHYRLRQVDYDGSFTLSDIRVVSPDDASALTLYPNPVSRLLTLGGGGVGLDNLRLYSSSGRELTSRITTTPIGGGKVILDLGTLRKGQYILKYGTRNHLIIKQ